MYCIAALYFTLSRSYIFCLIPTPFTHFISQVYIAVRGIFSYIPDDADFKFLLLRILILKILTVILLKQPHPEHQHRHANNTLKEQVLNVKMPRLKTNQVLMAILIRNEA